MLSVDGNSLPLSELQNYLGVTNRHLGTQTDVFWEQKTATGTLAVDLTSENSSSLGGTTTFTVLGSDGQATAAGYTIDGDGEFTFTGPGRYYVSMTNSAIFSDGIVEVYDPATGEWNYQTVSGEATAITGAIRVFNADYQGAVAAFGKNASSLAAALDQGIAAGVTPTGLLDDAILAVDQALEEDDAGRAEYIFNSLHGETLAGGIDAVTRVAPRSFAAAVFGQARRANPFEEEGGAFSSASGASGWNAYASVSGCAARPFGGGVFADGSIANLSSHDGYLGYDLYNAGANAYLDRWLSSDVLVGGSFGVSHTKVDWDRYSAKTRSDNLSGALYASVRRGGFTLAGQAFLGYGDASSSRRIPSANERASADYHLWWGGGALRASYRFELGGGFTLTPSAGLDYVHSRSNAFTEKNAGVFNLRADSQNHDNLEGVLDVEASRTFCVGSVRITPSLRAGVAVEMADRQTTVTTGFASMPTMPRFSAESSRLDRTRFLAGAWLDVRVSERVTLEFDYSGSFQNHYNDHRFSLGVAARF